MIAPRWCRVVRAAMSLVVITSCGNSADVPDTGEIRVTVATVGPEPDSNGYRVKLDGAGDRWLGPEDSTSFEGVGPGNHSVLLGDVADNCVAADGGPRDVTVSAGLAEHVAFRVTCTATAALRVMTRSEGAPADPDGYQLLVPGRGMRPIGANQSITMTGLRPGPVGIQLTDVAETCAVADTSLQKVVLLAGDTAEVTFRIACAASTPSGDGTIVVTVRTQAVNAPMPTGYTLTLDGGRPTSVAATQSVTLAHVGAGRHWVKLSGMPPWCIAGSGGFPGVNPVQVSVTDGSVTTVTFGVLCLG